MAPQRPHRTGNQPPRRPKANSNSYDRPKSAGPGSDRKAPGSRRPPGPAARRPSGPSKPSAPRPNESSGSERLQKILAHAGVGSRRACEDLILQGRVTAGGKVIRELGTKVDPARTPVAVDGQKVQVERPVYFAVYKPKGYVSTNNDPSGRPRVLDLLPEIPQRVYTVGRLDEMSVGLMLLTNDGELANKLAHPRFGVEKLYRVVVAGSPPREVLNQLVEGIWLAEGKVRAKSVRAVGKRGESTILELVLAEGKNREVRRMLAKLGHKVMTLTRVAVGPITIKGLTAGQFRPLTGKEVDLLHRVADGQSVPMPWMSDRKPRREPERPRRPEGPPRPGPRSQSGGPPRHADSPRPGPGGMSRHPTAPGMPQHPGVRPSERPSNGRRPEAPARLEEYRPQRDNGPRPSGRPGGHGQDRRQQGDGGPRPSGPRQFRENGPRPSNRNGNGNGDDRRPGPRPGGYGQDRRGQGDGPPRPNGPRQFRDDGPRPSNGHGDDRRPGPRAGGYGQDRRGQGDGPPRPNGPRMYREDGPRPSNQDDRRPGPRPNGQGGSNGGRRPGPRPSQEPPQRRVIGMGPQPSAPRPAPAADPTPAPARDDRPKPRMKRPPGKRPMPKPRKAGRRNED
jgi:23S rRNA pseudouridine2605 synthase